MRLPNSAQTSQPWRIHALTRDFRLEDVWALPTPGERDDFPRLVRLLAAWDPAASRSAAVRGLFAIRGKVGDVLGWDEGGAGLDASAETVRDRLPGDLRDGPTGPTPEALPFTPLYLTDDEWAGEVANRTVHGVLHFGWVPAPEGGHRGQMAIYVKRNGLLGAAYMAAIAPFRHLLVYPQATRELGRRWDAERLSDRAP